jgi:NAD(P)H-dependent FMN reductase
LIPRILILPGSAESGSPTLRLAGEATRLLAMTDVALTTANLADYPLPILDGAPPGAMPENARLLAGRFALQDAVLVIAPEVHAGIAPLLKNAIDWIAAAGATLPPQATPPFRRVVVGLAGLAPAEGGTGAGLRHLREVLTALGAEIVTAECRITAGETLFDADGRLAGEGDRRHLDDLVDTLLDHARALGRGI